MAKFFFNSSVHPYQIYSVAISYKLRKFLKRSVDNSIEFCNCSSHCNWGLHLIVDKETKKFNLILILQYKSFWYFSRENKCDNILNIWKMYFQASDDKG